MDTNASLLTTASKTSVDTTVGDYGAAVYDHVTGDWTQHTQMLVYSQPYNVATNFSTSAKALVSVYTGFKEVKTPAPDIILSGPVGQFPANDINFYTAYAGKWQPLGHPSYGVLITGTINVTGGNQSYSFTLKSAEGGYLWIVIGSATMLVINNGGVHNAVTKSGLAPLQNGNYSFIIKSYSNRLTASGVDLTLPSGISYVSSGITLTSKTVADSTLYMLMDYANGTTAATKGIALPAIFSGVISPTITGPLITEQPSDLSITSGTTVSFSVAALSSLPVTYQWYFNSTVISGATSPVFTLPGATFANAGSYSVAVTNDNGSTMSAVATLTVT